MDINYITPVEKRGDFYFKRDDLYKPYDFSPVNGSKLRQCQLLVRKNIDLAKNGIITGTSVLSPQSAIAASVAKEYGIPCTIFYGGTTNELLIKRPYPNIAIKMGANTSIVSKLAYTSVLASKAEEYASTHNLFHIRYGFDLLSNIDCFIESVANQTSNIPTCVKNLVITVGSSITLIGVLYGMSLFGSKIDNVYAIGCAPNRLRKIEDYAHIIYFETGVRLPLNKIIYIDAFNNLKGYKYENIKNEEYMGIKFHPRYEAKTYNWLKGQKIPNCLMWITGSDFKI